jgi:hypothetical protein
MARPKAAMPPRARSQSLSSRIRTRSSPLRSIRRSHRGATSAMPPITAASFPTAALRKDVAVFRQVPAKGVDALGALTHQEIAGSKHDAVRLLLFGLDRNKAHAQPLGRFTDRLAPAASFFCRLMNGLT